ncbi:hypothetical protein MKW98_009805, partial [Papaver atlanticum]
MPYVPPHLRSSSSQSSSPSSSSSQSTTGNTKPSSETLDSDQQQLHKTWNSNNNNNNSSSSSFNGARRTTSSSSSSNLPVSRTLSVPEAVFHQWKPSERVSRLQPEQIEEVRLRLNVDVTAAPDSAPAPAPIESFTDMCLHESIMKDIAFHEYTRPTSIQAQAMPIALQGRDLLGCAETGSGKTAAFAIPMIQHCLAQPSVRRGDGPLALVLAPTRELAQQIEKEVKAFSRSLESFRTAIVVGGTNMAEQ